jgi:hypothetical protein
MKNPHDYPQLLGRIWEDCNKILLATLSQFIDLNITGWEAVTCNQCGQHEDDCKPPCAVALAILLRDSIK